ncbi:glycosyltransferase [Vibrio scophthalmi]|uniref:hypothetical protein n=1 Tax=Vibrio scophthalmi TaxID=45658 RepID=UPI003AABE0DD
MKAKYIVIASPSIGGAERRFFDLFKGMRNRDLDVYLVAPSMLLKKLDENHTENKHIISVHMKRWSYMKFCFKYLTEVLVYSSKNDVFHYPLNPPFFLHALINRNYSISYCYCYDRPRLSLKSIGLSLQKLASPIAKKIDILSPAIYEHFRYDSKCSLTPGGTYINSDELGVMGSKDKYAIVTRLEEGKGVDLFFKIIKLLTDNKRLLRDETPKFCIYGDGSLKGAVENEIIGLCSEGIQVEYMGYKNPSEIFHEVKVIFSLQGKTNYPSRVVAESLISGTQVIVLDSGDSKSFGSVKGLHYLDMDLNNLIEIINDITSVKDSLTDRAEISNFAKGKFSNYDYIDYFDKVIS